MPDHVNHTKRPASMNPPSSIDQSPVLNSRKRPSAEICKLGNMACSKCVATGFARMVNLARFFAPGCDPGATVANIVRWLVPLSLTDSRRPLQVLRDLS